MRYHEILAPSRSTLLAEGILTEGLVDRIKTAATTVSNRYDDIKYDLLARITTKAMTMFAGGAEATPVQKALRRIAKVGKTAIRNRALLVILVGMVSVLIGLSHNASAAVNASQKIDRVLEGPIDDIIERLMASGIDIKAETGDANLLASVFHGLPPETSHTAEKVAKALRAIQNYEFHGVDISSERSSSISSHIEASIDGMVQKTGNEYHSHMKATTLDGKLTLTEITTDMVDGKITKDTSGGITSQLHHLLQQITDLSKKANHDLSTYITRGNPGSRQYLSNPRDIEELLRDKAPAFSSAFAAALSAKPDGVYRVRLDNKGVKVLSEKPAAQPAPPVAAPAPAQAAPVAAPVPAAPVTPAPVQAAPTVAPQAAPVRPVAAPVPAYDPNAQLGTTATPRPASPKPANPAMWQQALSAYRDLPNRQIAMQSARNYYEQLGGAWA